MLRRLFSESDRLLEARITTLLALCCPGHSHERLPVLLEQLYNIDKASVPYGKLIYALNVRLDSELADKITKHLYTAVHEHREQIDEHALARPQSFVLLLGT